MMSQVRTISHIVNDMSEERKETIVRKIANLFATLYLYDESPTLLDRLANALSKEAVAKVLYDAQRVVQMGLRDGDITTGKEKIDEKELFVINIRKEYKIVGLLPSDRDVEDFLSLVEKDVYYARKAGALAMSIVNDVLSRAG